MSQAGSFDTSETIEIEIQGGPSFQNLGIKYVAGTGTFTIQGAQDDLSASNQAFVTLPSKGSLGRFTNYTLEANQDFIDDNGASQIIGNTFGLTSGDTWAQDIPFFIYAVTNDDEDNIQFMISRLPSFSTSPVVSKIGAPDDAVANTQGSFWSLDNIDETLYDENPCFCVGSFRMQMSSSDDWTVQTIDFLDGMGLYQENRLFTYPTGVFGAASGKYVQDNGGTAPGFETNVYLYSISRSNICRVLINLDDASVLEGNGNVEFRLTFPYIPYSDYAAISGRIGSQTNYYPGYLYLQDSQNYAITSHSNQVSGFLENGDFDRSQSSINAGNEYLLSQA
jgi:hypothetical protein